VPAILTAADVISLQEQVRRIHVDEDIARYIIRLIDRTRAHPDIALGASPRASLNLFRACQARACLYARNYTTPDDVAALFLKVVAHRISLTSQARYSGRSETQVLSEIAATEKAPV